MYRMTFSLKHRCNTVISVWTSYLSFGVCSIDFFGMILPCLRCRCTCRRTTGFLIVNLVYCGPGTTSKQLYEVVSFHFQANVVSFAGLHPYFEKIFIMTRYQCNVSGWKVDKVSCSCQAIVKSILFSQILRKSDIGCELEQLLSL